MAYDTARHALASPAQRIPSQLNSARVSASTQTPDMDSFPDSELAEKTLKTIAAVMSDVAWEKRNLALTEAASSLLWFSEDLARNNFGVDKTALEKDGMIWEVLQEVEKVISIGTTSTGNDFPTLSALAKMRNDVDDNDEESRFAASHSLNHLQVTIRTRFEDLIKRNIRFKSLLDLVQQCYKNKSHETPDFAAATAPFDEPPDYQQQVATLYEVLNSHVVCHCKGHDVLQQHWAKLRLTPTAKLEPKGRVQFEMLFSDSPNPARTGIYWQDVQMLVSRNSRRVRISENSQSSDLANEPVIDDSEDSERVEEGQFCTHISSRCRSSLRFRVAPRQLRILDEGGEIEQFINSTGGVTLESLLNNFQMPHGMRPVLAYVLAKSVWQYYNSEWMTTVWTKKKVFFMEVDEKDNSSYYCKPYAAMDFGTTGREASESFKFTGVMHKFPRILALGIMLLEIGVGQSGLEDPQQWTARTVNEQWAKAKTLLECATFEADCDYPTYKLAVKSCLDFKLFKNVPFTPSKPKQYLKDRRSILYQEVVHPLHGFVKGAGWNSEYKKLERIPLEAKLLSRDLPTRSIAMRNDEFQIPNPVLSLHQASDLASEEISWLRKIDWLNEIIKKKKKIQDAFLKIAVLDTGCDPEAPSLRLPGRKKIKLWKDFVSESSTLTDDHGHGTHLATLILQIAPYAEVCVARVAEQSSGLESSADNVAKAIHTAVFDWDVDFVSMSFGFPRYVQCIDDAITKATSHKSEITFFSAANNDGSNSSEMFPANCGGSVLSIRGTNIHGGFEREFNPPKSGPGPAFGTLGRDVYSDWTGQGDPRSMSGSSVATAVAVGIAAMLLEYATRSGDFDSSELRLMRSRRGITELFTEIGVPEHDRSEHYYVAPFDLFNSWSERDRLAKIRTAISRHPKKRGVSLN